MIMTDCLNQMATRCKEISVSYRICHDPNKDTEDSKAIAKRCIHKQIKNIGRLHALTHSNCKRFRLKTLTNGNETRSIK